MDYFSCFDCARFSYCVVDSRKFSVSDFESLDCLGFAGCIKLPPHCFHLFFLAPLGPPHGLPSPCPCPFPFPFPTPSCSLISCNLINASVTIWDNIVFARDTASRCPILAYQPSSFHSRFDNKHVEFPSDFDKNQNNKLWPRNGLRSGGWSGSRRTGRTAARIVQIPDGEFVTVLSVGPRGPISAFKVATFEISYFKLLKLHGDLGLFLDVCSRDP